VQLAPHEKAFAACQAGRSPFQVATHNPFRNTYQYTFRPNGQYLSEMEFDNFGR
jgi:hypothetical protein